MAIFNDNIFQKYKGPLAFTLYLDEPRQYWRDLYQTHALLFVLINDLYRQIQCLIRQKRKRSGSINSHRRQNRINNLTVIFIQPAASFFTNLTYTADPDTITFQLFKDRQHIFILELDLFMRRSADFIQLFLDCKPGSIALIDSIFPLIPQSGHTHHKKFIQIRRGNRNKLQAFQQRRRFDCSFLQYAQVKFQPTQFTVKKIFRFVQIYAFHLFTHPF